MTRLAATILSRLRWAVLAALEVHEAPLPDYEAVQVRARQALLTEMVDATFATYDWDEDWADDVVCWESEAAS